MIGRETLVLGEEAERVDDRLEELSDRLMEAESGSQGAQALHSRANTLETSLMAISRLIDEYGEDAEVRVRGLTAGPYARVDDYGADISASRPGSGGAPGSRRNVFAAAGLLEAPFLDEWAGRETEHASWAALREAESLSERERIEKKLACVSELPVGVVDWLEDRVNDLTTLESDDFRRLSERLADRSSNSDPNSKSSTQSES